MKSPELAFSAALLTAWPALAAAAEADTELDPEPPPSAPKTEIGVSLLAGYGAGGDFEDSGLERFGLGVGARVGATLAEPRLYLGASFVHFSGDEDDSREVYTNTLDAELGYDFRLLEDRLVVRPGVGVGVAQVVTLTSHSRGYPLAFHFAPGLLVGLRLPPLLVSAEVRRDFMPGAWSDGVPGDWANAVSVLLGVGAVF